MSENKSTGIGFLGLLTLIFITLRLTHVIDWSWLWVTAPIWGIPALIVGVLLVTLVVGFFAAAIKIVWESRL